MHGWYRMFKAFIMKCAKHLENPQILEDPPVSKYNVHRFFILNVLTPACGEYVIELCDAAGEPDAWSDYSTFLPRAEQNINFAWIVHFLHDNAFWVLDFLQSVRGNKSKRLDTLWAEFFACAHSGTAHKTQYVGMALLRVFWGQCLHPDLDALYHAIRTMPSGEHNGCGVGWDWPIELFNGAIKFHVDTHVSEAQINSFCDNWAFVEHVKDHLRSILYVNRAEKHWRGRNVRADIDKLKAFFRKEVGATLAEATRRNTTQRVTAGHDRAARPPWREINEVLTRRGNDAMHVYIREYIERMTKFFEWVP